MAGTASGRTVERVREFSRFYTRVIGALEAGIAGTPYSLTEARVLFELAQSDELGVSELRRILGIDAGYLSRILRRFTTDGLAVRESARDDGRRQVVRLTEQGRAAYGVVEAQQVEAVERMLDHLDEEGRRRLVAAMDQVRRSLEADTAPPRWVVLRAPAPGELGWIVARHSAGTPVGEAAAARLVADLAARADPREAAWIAEADGDPVGCVLCVADAPGGGSGAARLALLHVEPAMRGSGIGSLLVAECVRFARASGYVRLTASAPPGPEAARFLERAGFAPADGDGWERTLAGNGR